MMRVLLAGPAGSGKGTVAKLLLKEFDQYGFGYFSAGDLIRDHIQRGTEFGQRASSFFQKGEHIPDSLLNGLLISQVVQKSDRLILDGYPRNLHQLKAIEEVAPITLAIELKVPRKVLIDRLSKQLVHPASGRAYHLEFNPPKVEGKDDVTGEPLFHRDVDATEVVRRRLEVHEKTEAKVIDYYKSHGNCLSVVGETSSVVFQQICEAMVAAMDKKHLSRRG